MTKQAFVNIGIKLSAVALVFGIGFGAAELPRLINSHDSLDASSLCHLSSQPCQNETLTVLLDADTTKAMLPTQMMVSWPSNQSDSIMVSLKGVEMEMGEPRFILDQTSEGEFTGELLLPVCTQERMTWIASIGGTDTQHKFALTMEN